MSEDDQLLRALGRVGRERDEAPPEAAQPPLAELARARIADDIVAHMRPAVKPAWSRWPWAAGGLAAAAALALLVRSRESEVDPFPLYTVQASGASVVRGPSAAAGSCALRASEQGAFEVVAQANDVVSGTIGAQAFVVRGGAVEPSPVSIEASAKGSVRITGASRLLLGASELRIVVGRGAEATAERARRHAMSTSEAGRGWQTVRCSIEN